jgi:hypothetical protein
LPESVRKNPNILYYQRSFHDDIYERLLERAHLVVHVSPVDSGPQVVAEALSQGIPVVITNNMGGAEWVRAVGPRAGIVLEVDRYTRSYHDLCRLIPYYMGPRGRKRWVHWTKYAFDLCRAPNIWSDTRAHRKVALAMKQILDHYDDYRFDPPRWLTVDGITDRWVALLESLVRGKSALAHHHPLL